MKKNKRKNKKKKSEINTAVLIVIVVILIIFGIFAIRYNFAKADSAKNISERILNLYLNAEKEEERKWKKRETLQR